MLFFQLAEVSFSCDQNSTHNINRILLTSFLTLIFIAKLILIKYLKILENNIEVEDQLIGLPVNEHWFEESFIE